MARRFPGALLSAFTTGTVVGGFSVAYWESIAHVGNSTYDAVESYFSTLSPAAVNFMTFLGCLLGILALIISLIPIIYNKPKTNPDPIHPITSPDGSGSKNSVSTEDTITATVIVKGKILNIPRIDDKDELSHLFANWLMRRLETETYSGYCTTSYKMVVVASNYLYISGCNLIIYAFRKGLAFAHRAKIVFLSKKAFANVIRLFIDGSDGMLSNKLSRLQCS